MSGFMVNSLAPFVRRWGAFIVLGLFISVVLVLLLSGPSNPTPAPIYFLDAGVG